MKCKVCKKQVDRGTEIAMKNVPRPKGQSPMSYERLGGSCSYHPTKKICVTIDEWLK